MINRRNFLGALSASAALAAVPVLAGSSHPVVSPARTRISLNGEWERHIGDVLYDTVLVPSSLRPSGNYILKRKCVLPQLNRGQRVFVHFEAIAFWGRVTVNGNELGTTSGPYIPAEFECTAHVQEGMNEVEVQIVDLEPLPDGSGTAEVILGHNPGWEASGGIIRDVWVEIRPVCYVENVRLAYTLHSDFSACSGRPSITVSSTGACDGTAEVTVRRGLGEVARVTQSVQFKAGTNDVELAFEFKHPSLWSPESPNLYELTVSLETPSGKDMWTCHTGFRDIRTQGRDFLLNGKRLVLNGVCRHDLWPDQGFTLTRSQQERDMRMIKAIGCNFVRLVHYPHDRHIVELADQLGLLVSEEPGFWQVDFATAARPPIEMGFRILEGTIRRDWNSPSVMIWFISNECTLTEKSLREGKERCNRLDPIKRLVAAANDRPAKDVKPLFVDAEMDFFDQHPYTDNPAEFAEEAAFDGPSKPLIFSEWGGKSVGQNEPLMQASVNRLIDLIGTHELAGTMFWSWQDIREYSRIDGEMRNGVLQSGVVTEARESRELVARELKRLFHLRRQAGEQPLTNPGSDAPEQEISYAPDRPTVLPLRVNPFSRNSNFRSVDLQAIADSQTAKRSWKALETELERYWASTRMARDQWKRTGDKFELWKIPEVKISGVTFHSPSIESRVRPLVLTTEVPEVTVPIDQPCTVLHILGQVTFGTGYPLRDAPDLFGNIPSATNQHFGDTAAEYTLQFAGGKMHTLPVRNGIEIAQANRIYGASRILPIATSAQPALEYIKDVVREHYQVLLWSIPIPQVGMQALHCKLLNAGNLAIFAITTEQ
ncbi:MAG: twin-arginine translocation signal domain-containing protein [Acidobacteria bacterium]|nr:twin-arginine translocation signal domain-containing protein [Acidobacteriota bacterium]